MSNTSTATMASAIPRTPRPPPTGPLPALPIARSRKSSGDNVPEPSRSRRGSTASLLPTSSTKKTPVPSRSVTPSALPTPKPGNHKASSTPAVPTLTSLDSLPPPPPSDSITPLGSAIPKTLRKTTSIGSFPLPPKGAQRVNSLPPSPLSASASSNEPNVSTPSAAKRDHSKHRSAESGVRKSKTRSSGYGLRPRVSHPGPGSSVGSPSLLNGTGESAMISSGKGGRQSDSLLSLPSPPQSRSSSAEGSYATDVTPIEDVGDEPTPRGRSRNLDRTSDAKQDAAANDQKGNVLVSVRVRPDAAGGDNQPDGEWMVDGRRSLISYRGREGGDYRYDNVFSPHDNNSRVYDNAAKRLVRRVMEGYHGTVFAYGMTGTGKTFSMQGTATAPGVIPLAITDIFSYIRENPNREFLLRVSYLEIYNEKIFDLLSQSTPGQQQEEIKLREDSKRGVYATPLKEEIVQSPNQLLRVIARGDSARRTGSTQFNARSSRSHAVVQIVVESRARAQSHGEYFKKETRRSDKITPGGVLVSTLSLIDLAGSEKAADNKERRTEGAHINKSLLTLGTVIAKISGEDEKDEKAGGKTAEKDKSLKHLPYRDSKLTRLLQPALSGNSLVSILCTIQLSAAGTSAAHSSTHTGETLNTLKFASRAKNNLVSHAKRNESNPTPGDPNSRALLDRYRMEIQDLRNQLEQQNKIKEEVTENDDEFVQDRKVEEQLEREEQTRHEEQMLEMQLARTALKERISHLNRLILSSKSLGVNSGRFSSTSLSFNPRMSTFSSSQSEYGRPVSVRSRDSTHSTQRDSTATLDTPFSSNERTLSGGSVIAGALPTAQPSQMESEDHTMLEDEDVDYARGDDDADDHASLSQQNRMLQADLSDKNRYIATLEKRLLQARRTSHSRVSMHFATRVGIPEEGSLEGLLREKDREIEELRAKLDDQMRMVTALRSAARKRDMLDKRKSYATTASEDTARPSTPNGVADVLPDLQTLPFRRQASSRASRSSNQSATGRASRDSHRRTLSNASRSSSGPGPLQFSKTPLSPMALLSPTHSSSNSRDSIGKDGGGFHSVATTPRRKSVDEMTQLLDQMIQEKVENQDKGETGAGGPYVVRTERGSLRFRHDTMLAQIADQESVLEEEDEEGQAVVGAPSDAVAALGTTTTTTTTAHTASTMTPVDEFRNESI